MTDSQDQKRAAISERKADQPPVIVRLAQSHVPLSRAVLPQNVTGVTFRNGQHLTRGLHADGFLLIDSVIDTIYGVGCHIRTTLAQRRGPEGTG